MAVESLGLNIVTISDYFCAKLIATGENPNVPKLQKLLYYAQAKFLALYSQALFDDEFEGWEHGPVCRVVHQRFQGKSPTISSKELDKNAFKELPVDVKKHLIDILNEYGCFTLRELEEYHISREQPWINSRVGVAGTSRDTIVIPKDDMMEYHKKAA